MCCEIYEIILILCLPIQSLNFGLKLEGLIDLGPKWNYIYRLSPIRDSVNKKEITFLNDYSEEKYDRNEKNSLFHSNDESDDSDGEFVNKGRLQDQNLELQHDYIEKGNIETKKSEEMYKKEDKDRHHYKSTKRYFGLRNTYLLKEDLTDNSDKSLNVKHKIDKTLKKNKHSNPIDRIDNKKLSNKTKGYKTKDNKKIRDFQLHVFKQSLKVFDNINKLTNQEKEKQKINLLKDAYIHIFGDFLNDTERHKLKTNLANQNLILNTMDMSNKILKRLVYHIPENDDRYMKSESRLRTFEREVEKEKEIENIHACNKLGICRKSEGFTDFIIEILKIILETSNSKIKQAADALAEIVKTNDFTYIIDYETQGKLRRLMTNIESWDPFLLRSMFIIMKKVIENKNQPLTIMEIFDETLANKTILFHDIIDIMNKNTGKVEDKVAWKDMRRKIEEWRDGTRNDIQKTLEKLIEQIKNVLETLDYSNKERVKDIMKILLT